MIKKILFYENERYFTGGRRGGRELASKIYKKKLHKVNSQVLVNP